MDWEKKCKELEKKILELEAENKSLKQEVEELLKRKMPGRKKHDSTWTKSYEDFVVMYNEGVPMETIAKKQKRSIRTIYRYKEQLLKNIEKDNISSEE